MVQHEHIRLAFGESSQRCVNMGGFTGISHRSGWLVEKRPSLERTTAFSACMARQSACGDSEQPASKGQSLISPPLDRGCGMDIRLASDLTCKVGIARSPLEIRRD